MRKTKLLKQTLTGTLAATLLFAPIAEPMQGVFFENGIIAEAADSDFVIKDGVLTKYKGDGGDVVIPEGVTKIADKVFSEKVAKDSALGHAPITSIVLPESLKSIGASTFSYCESLKEIEIPNSVTDIGKYAFNRCTKLKKVTLPESLTSISAYLFTDCCSLEKIKIPKKVKSIGQEAFYDCDNLKKVTLQKGLTTIGKAAFENCNELTNITFPNTLTTIQSNAFRYCEQLTDITFPDSVTIIGSDAFYHCTNLSDITFSANITDLNYSNFDGTKWAETHDYLINNQYQVNGLKIVNNVVVNGKSCEGDIIIPDGVTSIADNAFFECEAITSVTIPDSVTSIGDQAFYACYNLAAINIPKSVTHFGVNAFTASKWFENQIKNSMIIINGILVFCSSPNNGEIVLPDTIYKIGSGGFLESNVKSVVIPNSITSIDKYAFNECKVLESVTVTGSAVTGGGIISSYAFNDCPNLKSVTLPEATTIESCAFNKCDTLESVILPNTITTLNSTVFSSCPSLKSITIPSSVTNIEGNLIKNYRKTIIYGEEGSKIQSYAKEKKYLFALSGTQLSFPEEITISSAKRKSSTSFKLTLKADPNAVGYEIKYAPNNVFHNSTTVSTTSAQKTFSNLKKNKTYYVEARAYTLDANGNKAYGDWSVVKKIKLKK